jgi:hypothetical protein
MRIRKLWLGLSFALLLSQSEPLSAQQAALPQCDVPLVVAGFNAQTRQSNQMLLDLRPEDLVVHVGPDQVSLESMKVDAGPKRLALILDPSRDVPDQEWNLEAEMAARMVEIARPNDKFLLFLEGIDRPEEQFLSPEEADKQLRALTLARPSTPDSTERTYDTLFDAARRLDPPAFGDTLVLFGHAEDAGSKTDPDQVLQLILRNRQRLFGFSFRDPLRGKLTPDVDLNKPLPEPLRSLADPKLAQMSRETGYFVSFRSVESLKLPGQMNLHEGFMSAVYAWIAQPYRLRIQPAPTKEVTRLRIEVLNPKARIPRADSPYYPHTLYPCFESTSTVR